jgi:hypothetical protein
MVPNTGKFKIERNNLEEFWELYQDLLFTLNNEFMAGINERPSEFMPVLGDIDIAIPYNEDEDVLKQHLKPTDKSYFAPTTEWDDKRSHDRTYS